MRCRTDSGSVSLECAGVMAGLTALMMFFLSLFQIAAAETVFKTSVAYTAGEFARWAPVYRNGCITDISDDILTEIGGSAAGIISKIPFTGDIINLRNMSEYVTDGIYTKAAEAVCRDHINDDVLVRSGIVSIKDIDLDKSAFFHGGSNDIILAGQCGTDTYFPLDTVITYRIKCAAWGTGNVPLINTGSGDESSASTIWDLDNFTRGKIIRQLYGANLPESFPVIAAFNDGMAVMIKSLNHRAESYKDTRVLENTVKQMIDSLAAFKGAKYGDTVINAGDIRGRKLILVMPENEFTQYQKTAINLIMVYAARQSVFIDLQRYQTV